MELPLDVLAGHIARAPDRPHVILDVGAADGWDTLRYAARFPTAQVLAFEPLAFNVGEIRRTLGSRGLLHRVRIFEMALSDRDGEFDFWVSGGTPPDPVAKLPSPPGPRGWRYSSSLLEPHEHRRRWPWVHFTHERVRARRFDGLAAEAEIDAVDFAHLDVQGAELAVLRGMGERLEPVAAIWLEVSNAEMYRGQPLRPEVSAFLSEAGFVLALDTLRDEPQGDQLWVREIR